MALRVRGALGLGVGLAVSNCLVVPLVSRVPVAESVADWLSQCLRDPLGQCILLPGRDAVADGLAERHFGGHGLGERHRLAVVVGH